jgi:excisionase family DNA binding protein
MEKKFFNVEEIAEYLGVKKGTIYSWVHQGKIPHTKMNGSVRFAIKKIDEWTGNNTIEPSPIC